MDSVVGWWEVWWAGGKCGELVGGVVSWWGVCWPGGKYGGVVGSGVVVRCRRVVRSAVEWWLRIFELLFYLCNVI